MIQFGIEGRRVLDLFAGSGQMGLEALSRGAESATFCDSSQEAVNVIKHNAQKTHLFERCRVLKTDCRELIRSLSGRERFDIVFLDPPYALNCSKDIIDRLVRADLLARGAIVISESESPEPVECEGLGLLRHSKYGRTYITVLEKPGEE